VVSPEEREALVAALTKPLTGPMGREEALTVSVTITLEGPASEVFAKLARLS
jgi:hypothetical protein